MYPPGRVPPPPGGRPHGRPNGGSRDLSERPTSRFPRQQPEDATDPVPTREAPDDVPTADAPPVGAPPAGEPRASAAGEGRARHRSPAPGWSDRARAGLGEVRRRPALAMVGVGILAAVALVALLLPDSTTTPPGGTPAAAALTPEPAVHPLDPGAFVDGGCVVFNPTTPRPKATVALDPGHGGIDPGSGGKNGSGQDVAEKDLTLPLALRTEQDLRDRGYRVVLTRTRDELGNRLAPGDMQNGALSEQGVDAELTARAHCANIAHADAFLSVHFNAFGQDPSVRGAETIYSSDRPFSDRNRALATSVHSGVLRGFDRLGRPTDDRGLIAGSANGNTDSDLTVLGPLKPGNVTEPSAMPGALIEPGLISNPGDVDALQRPDGMQTLAHNIADGLDGYLVGPR